MPVEAPKTYFADRNETSCNFILITEKLHYASDTLHPHGTRAELPPMALQRAYTKLCDHHIGSAPLEYYDVLVRKLGTLAGWYKADHTRAAKLNADFQIGPPGFGAGSTPEAMGTQLDMLVEFMGTVGYMVFPPDVADVGYLANFKAEVLHMAKHFGAITEHLLSDPDYIAYTHPNLNIDNAYWWRDEQGKLDAGLIDWSGFRATEVTSHLDMCLFAGEWPLQEANQQPLLAAFAQAYSEGGGPQLDVAELSLRFDLTLALSFAGQVGVAPTIYSKIPRREWPTVTDRMDARIDGADDKAFLLRSYLMGLVYRVTRWKRSGVYRKVVHFLEQKGLS